AGRDRRAPDPRSILGLRRVARTSSRCGWAGLVRSFEPGEVIHQTDVRQGQRRLRAHAVEPWPLTSEWHVTFRDLSQGGEVLHGLQGDPSSIFQIDLRPGMAAEVAELRHILEESGLRVDGTESAGFEGHRAGALR